MDKQIKRLNGIASISNYLFLLLMLMGTNNSFAQKNPRNITTNWKTDTTNRTVPLDEFTTLLVRDGIPPIDNPSFVDLREAKKMFFEYEPVIAVEINNEARAYPLSILMYHEIVNDEIGGTKIIATYCPLCNAAIVFNRTLAYKGNNYLLDFGVSGMLRKSDMVMWDRQTETWWQQFTGEGVVGKLAGAGLEYISSMLISLKDFTANYPTGKVLSSNNGKDNQYGRNPYVDYDNLRNKQPLLFKDSVDSRLPAMERIIDVKVNESVKIYSYTAIEKQQVINDVFKEKPIVIFYESKTVSVLNDSLISQSKAIGSVTVFSPVVQNKTLAFIKKKKSFFDEQSGSEWTITGKCINGKFKGEILKPIKHGNHFAFAWFAFNPDSEIYQKTKEKK